MDLSNTPAALPPPGYHTDFNSPDNYIVENYVTHSIVLFCTTLAVCVRIYTRRCIKHFLGVDDILIILSWLSCITFSGLMIGGHMQGYGHHIWNVPVTKLYNIGKIQFIGEMIYNVMLITIKNSILLTYKRIFSTSRIGTWLLWAGIVTVTTFYIPSCLLSVFWCKPIAKAWYPILDGHCANYDVHVVLGTSSGIFNIITDTYILVLPMPFVWQLNMRRNRKIRVMAVFGLGVVTCVFSLIRLILTIKFISHPDQLYFFVKYMAFLLLEVHVGLICGCALVFPAFFDPENKGSLGSLIAKFSSSHSQTWSRTGSESETELRSELRSTSAHRDP